MKNSKYMFYGLGLALASTMALASPGEYEEYYQQRGPAPLEALDLDKDGVVSKTEHEAFREKRHAARINAGYRMRHASKAPLFEQMDTDANGAISRQEMEQWRSQRLEQRMGRMNR